jgi:hypothetical protein
MEKIIFMKKTQTKEASFNLAFKKFKSSINQILKVNSIIQNQ